MTQTPRKITAGEFGKALAEAGIINDLENVRRIVIDAKAGEPLRFYIEYFGDERMLNVAQFLRGIEVTVAGTPQ